METLTCGEGKKRKIEEKDRITELPEAVLSEILERAPLQDAVRTSALSRSWRYKWRSLNVIRVDESFRKKMCLKKDDFIRIVYDVLLNTNVPIRRFGLYIADQVGPSEEVVGNWILYLSKNKVMTFDLENQSCAFYKLPSHFYFCVELVHLALVGFYFKPPSTFQGFPYLQYLYLKIKAFDAESFAHFVTSCALLNSLNLEISDGTNHITICSASLRTLVVYGEIKSIFINAQGLESLEVVSYSLMTSDTRLEKSAPITAFGKLPNIKNIFLGGYTLQFLASGKVPYKYPIPTDSLTKITLHALDFEDDAEMSVALCMIRSAPSLQDLKIVAFWEARCAVKPVEVSLGDDILLRNLKFVKLKEVRGTKSELNLVKCLLACSPSLEKMIVKAKPIVATAGTNPDFYDMAVELMGFSRASPKAEIHFLKSI